MQTFNTHGVLGDTSVLLAYVPATFEEGLDRTGVSVSSNGRKSVGKGSDDSELGPECVVVIRMFSAVSTQSTGAKCTHSLSNMFPKFWMGYNRDTPVSSRSDAAVAEAVGAEPLISVECVFAAWTSASRQRCLARPI